ncbi:ATP synthase F1 subcomplex gamma subunit [Anseongella ginsenosidimutans]|uniref:ATP synthase gamma chain n=1 Tax=Anseongella ginsenosidimutans TaxID=496056 RepID=A0A4R3KZT2_9SPHI|nr:ATP synthase F1 subunit gamma [Anseongella ginsenosidimutans]QEC51187.1 ATP synthase F1 subunit gamma [Anseongella ginsenosidimutans]TCS90140.1 ATP synthase F1 subcomplex gamma subunit [Anseongella ginsenosidimutans]
MANLKEVRGRISSIVSTQQITKAMKMVSAARFRRATEAIVQMRPYANKLREILGNLSASMEDNSSVFAQERDARNVLLLVITSNRGLAGSFNMNVIKTANNLISAEYAALKKSGNLHIIAVGKKGQDYYQKHRYQVTGDHNELFNNLSFANASAIAEEVMEGYVEGKYDKVVMIYNQFRNAAVQIPTTEQLLPIQKAGAEQQQASAGSHRVDYILEPSQQAIVEELIPKSVKMQFYKALLDSHASEHGARMTAMDKATDNAGDLLRSLRLQYNRARQAAITNEILEIVSGANALSSGD